MSPRLGRCAIGLGIGAAASPLLDVAERAPLRLITFGVTGVLATLVLAAVAVVGGLWRLRPLVVLAGAGFLGAAVLQVIQASLGGTNTLGGDGSTVGLYLGFAVGLLAVGLTSDPATT